MDALQLEFQDRVAFVLADLSALEGMAFAARFGVGHTTLVFFDASGRAIDALYGVQRKPYLRDYIERTFRLSRE